MTEASYQEKLSMGLTGPETSACIAAGLDRSSLYHSVCENCYKNLQETMDLLEEIDATIVSRLPSIWQDRLLELMHNMYRDVGVIRPWQVSERRVSTPSELKSLLGTTAT